MRNKRRSVRSNFGGGVDEVWFIRSFFEARDLEYIEDIFGSFELITVDCNYSYSKYVYDCEGYWIYFEMKLCILGVILCMVCFLNTRQTECINFLYHS